MQFPVLDASYRPVSSAFNGILDNDKKYSFQKDYLNQGHKNMEYPLRKQMGSKSVSDLKQHVFEKYVFQEPEPDIAVKLP
jgi:hypothetical protein